ncbi:hypothetical protein [Bradyrhizobium sp. CCGB20]|uniref:hypothetical protein n=1 Tax=Bradyrhizobium sp. CCGB20 TaxID=2949633 RepID=UPI0020B2217D|nr:hypothetical protein [Bradyrhizobium sp. CCGB20]MCP3399922.1 hypothetical protein [Bradyrhizobium sp. CCGB20]
MKDVLKRLGYVLHWTCSGVAGLLVLVASGFGIAAQVSSSRADYDDALSTGTMYAAGAALSWLIGRISKFVLAGE